MTDRYDLDLCDGCHHPQEDCICDYLAAQEAADGDDDSRARRLGWTSESLDALRRGEWSPDDLLNRE